jgi:hypothetical protein
VTKACHRQKNQNENCWIAICAGDFPGIAVTSERLLIVRGRSEHWPSVP